LAGSLAIADGLQLESANLALNDREKSTSAIRDHIIRIDLRAVILCMKFQIRQFIAQGGDRKRTARPSTSDRSVYSPAYVAAKHVVIGLRKTGGLEHSPKGIRMSAVLLGAIDMPTLR
jgi:glucose 1-dehydrogenase